MLSNWIIVAVIAGLTSNLFHFFNRLILKDEKDMLINIWFFEFTRFIVFLFLAIFNFSFQFTLINLFILLLPGVVEIVTVYFFTNMHKFTHLSLSVIISRSRIFWVPLFAFLILGETLKLGDYFGLLILFVGLGIATAPHKIFVDKGVKYCYLFAIMASLGTVLLKPASNITSISLVMVFFSLPSIIFYPFLIKDFSKKMKKYTEDKLHIKIAAVLSNVLSSFLLVTALKIGPISKVNGIYQSMLIFAILAGIFLLNERKDLLRKIVGGTITLVGVLLLS